eukprot:TRINITY_DN5700_c0_g2_i1.p1 TRINITY_DN5700_c0_g2~~TRINITY_DN5700_c0_g2_i1.p1  ORF type:complete len:1097 (-),score=216.38 TRINITY_DN5700_c0_g2_i1:583-3873(-)
MADASNRLRAYPLIGLKQGYLSKLGNKVKSWKKRWFVLTNEKISYHTNASETEPLGVIHLKDIQSIMEASDLETAKQNTLKVATPNRAYLFTAETREDFEEWLSTLRAVASLYSTQFSSDRQTSQLTESARNITSVTFQLMTYSNQVALSLGAYPQAQLQVLICCADVGTSSIAFSSAVFKAAAKSAAAKNSQGVSLSGIYIHSQKLCESISRLVASVKIARPSANALDTARFQSLTIEFRRFIAPLLESPEGTPIPELKGPMPSSTLNSTSNSFITASSSSLVADAARSPALDVSYHTDLSRSMAASGRSLQTAPSLLSMTAASFTSSASSVLFKSPAATAAIASSNAGSEFAESLCFGIPRFALLTSAKITEIEKIMNNLLSASKETAALVIDFVRITNIGPSEHEFISAARRTVTTVNEFRGHIAAVLEFPMTAHMHEMLNTEYEHLTEISSQLIKHARDLAFDVELEIDDQSEDNVTQDQLQLSSCIKDIISITQSVVLQITTERHLNEVLLTIQAVIPEVRDKDETLYNMLLISKGVFEDCAKLVSIIMHPIQIGESDEETILISKIQSVVRDIKRLFELSEVLQQHIEEEPILEKYISVRELLNSKLLQFVKSIHTAKQLERLDYIALEVSTSFRALILTIQDLLVTGKSILQICGKISTTDDTNGVDVNIWDEGPDSRENIIFNTGPDGEGVKAATLNKLVERLVPHQISDLKYMKTFITTYRSFTTPDILFRKLVQRFHVPISKLPPSVSLEEYRITYIGPIQIRVCNVLKFWMEHNFSDFHDSLLVSFDEFIRTLQAEGQTKLADQLIATRAKMERDKLRVMASLKDGQRDSGKTGVSVDPLQLILQLSPDEVAKQLCIIDSKVFRSIKPVELLNQAWNKPKYKYLAPNVLYMIEHFNNLSKFVASSIVKREKLRDRIALYTKFIEIAQALRKHKNFNSLLSILSGFGNAAVHRLKFTKGGLSKSAINEMENLERQMSSKKSYAEFREILHTVDPPCVPYLGMYLTDLTFIDDGNPDCIDKLINFRKRDLTYNVVREIQQYQQLSYSYQPNPRFTHIFADMVILDDKAMYAESLKREPRNCEAGSLD